MSDNSINKIASQLWAMANELRGNMDAGEFKNYILAFMFYRYLSERQERYLVENDVIDVGKDQTVNEAYREQASGKNYRITCRIFPKVWAMPLSLKTHGYL